MAKMILSQLYADLLAEEDISFDNFSDASTFIQYCLDTHGVTVSITRFDMKYFVYMD